MNDLPSKLSKPAQRALSDAGINSLKRMSGFTEGEITRLHGVGPDAIKKIKLAFSEAGLSFKAKTDMKNKF